MDFHMERPSSRAVLIFFVVCNIPLLILSRLGGGPSVHMISADPHAFCLSQSTLSFFPSFLSGRHLHFALGLLQYLTARLEFHTFF